MLYEVITQTALRYDESNSMAAYLLGQIYFHEKNYAAAKRYFSYGLSYAPDSTYLLNALSAAAYYDRDLDTAGHASRKAYSLSPRDAGSIKNLMFADAANGYVITSYSIHYTKLYDPSARCRSAD